MDTVCSAASCFWLSISKYKAAKRSNRQRIFVRVCSRLFKIAQKVIEEAGETALAGLGQNKENTIGEISDLIYHLLVMMSNLEITPNDVWTELKTRSK